MFEVLVIPEFHEQGEENVQRLDHRFVASRLVHRNVTHRADQPRVVAAVHVDFSVGELNLLKRLFHLWRPLRHQRVKVWHRLAVVYGWWWPCLVQVLHSSYPPCDFFGLLVRLVN